MNPSPQPTSSTLAPGGINLANCSERTRTLRLRANLLCRVPTTSIVSDVQHAFPQIDDSVILLPSIMPLSALSTFGRRWEECCAAEFALGGRVVAAHSCVTTK